MAITHSKVSAIADGADTSLVRPSDWNDDHVVADGSLTIAATSGLQAALDAKSATSHDHTGTYQPLDTQLTDLAGLAYAGNTLKVVRVNAGETAFELATVSAGSVAGSDTQVQFNDGGSFGGDTKLVYDKTNDILKAPTTWIWDGTNRFFDLRSTNKFNVFIGYEAGLNCTTAAASVGGVDDGTANTGVGYQCMKALVADGWYNTAFGTHALTALTSGNDNVAIVPNALLVCTTGSGNLAIGKGALQGNISGGANIAIGNRAAESTVGTNYVVAIGSTSMQLSTGNYNTGVGYNSGANITTGAGNFCMGLGAGTDGGGSRKLQTGSGNIIFGVNSAPSSSSASGEFIAGSSLYAITNVYFGEGPLDATPVAVTINGCGGVGTDIAGANLRIAGGKGTGAGAPGKVVLQAPAVGTTGTTLQTLVDVLTIAGDKTAQIAALTVATLPAAGTGGRYAYVTDGDAALAWGATVINSGAGATKYLVWDNGTNWTVAGK
jgi:hypothetical protein